MDTNELVMSRGLVMAGESPVVLAIYEENDTPPKVSLRPP